MINWNKVQYQVSCYSPSCNIINSQIAPQLTNHFQSKTKQSKNIQKIQKISCPPSKRKIHNRKKSEHTITQNEQFKQSLQNSKIIRKKQNLPKQEQSLYYTQRFHKIIRPLFIPKTRYLQKQNNISFSSAKYIPILSNNKTMNISSKSTKQSANPSFVQSKGFKNSLKLKNFQSIASIQMKTVKSIFDTLPDQVRFEQSQIQLNHFKSKADTILETQKLITLRNINTIDNESIN